MESPQNTRSVSNLFCATIKNLTHSTFMWQGILFDDDKNGHFTKRFCHLQYLRLTHWDTVKGDAIDGNMIKFWWKWHINMISAETISKRLNSVQSNFSENWYFDFLPTNRTLPNTNQVTSFTHNIQKNYTISLRKHTTAYKTFATLCTRTHWNPCFFLCYNQRLSMLCEQFSMALYVY